MASSRVGVSTNARMGWPETVWAESRWRMGVAKAQVLPVPVWAQPSTSRPARAGGMAFSWMGEGA